MAKNKLSRNQQEMIDKLINDKEGDAEYWSSRSMLGNNFAEIFIVLGGRAAGKSYDVMRLFLKDWKKHHYPFTWLRLKEPSCKKLLQNNAQSFVDADLHRRFNLDLETKGFMVYDHGKMMARILALSTFYQDKGVALYDNEYKGRINICLDEFQTERGEKRTMDVTYAFVNQIENLVRDRKEGVRIFLVANCLEECSEILTLFNFIPEKFGRYYLRKKRTVIDYIKPTAQYIARRKGSIADLLAPTQSNFTNKIERDKQLITKQKLIHPSLLIKFSKDKNDWFVLWDGKVIKKYNNEGVKKISHIAMAPFIDDLFNLKNRDAIINMYHNRLFLYRDLITQQIFEKNLMLILHK